jgi:hypothetical protein
VPRLLALGLALHVVGVMALSATVAVGADARASLLCVVVATAVAAVGSVLSAWAVPGRSPTSRLTEAAFALAAVCCATSAAALLVDSRQHGWALFGGIAFTWLGWAALARVPRPREGAGAIAGGALLLFVGIPALGASVEANAFSRPVEPGLPGTAAVTLMLIALALGAALIVRLHRRLRRAP